MSRRAPGAASARTMSLDGFLALAARGGLYQELVRLQLSGGTA